MVKSTLLVRELPERPGDAVKEVVLRAVANAGLDASQAPDLKWLLAEIEARPEGVARGLALCRSGHVMSAVICWWRDPLGRRFLRVELIQDEGAALPPGGVGVGAPLSMAIDPDSHPLQWVAARSCGWRERDGKREFVVICRCGVAGTPESVAWRGVRCGPCADREFEGLPKLGTPTAGLMPDGEQTLFLLPGGRLLTALPAYEGLNEPFETMCFWSSPDVEAPTWRAKLRADIVADCFPFLAVLSRSGEVAVVDAENGVVLDADSLGHGWSWDGRDAAWAPAGGRWMLVASSRNDADFTGLAGLEVSRCGEITGESWRTVAPRCGSTGWLNVVGEGQFLVSFHDRIELRDACTGKVIEAASPDARPNFEDSRVAAVPGGGAIVWASYSPLLRWRSNLVPPPLCTSPTNRPVRNVVLGPDRDAAVLEGDAVIARCRDTLRLLASFQPTGCKLTGPLAFTPDGRLLAATDKGLAVWPWSELMGPA
jgi:hypothetical protein